MQDLTFRFWFIESLIGGNSLAEIDGLDFTHGVRLNDFNDFMSDHQSWDGGYWITRNGPLGLQTKNG